MASPTSPEILEGLPILSEFRNFEDPQNDFLLDHPSYLYTPNQVTSCKLNRDYNTYALISKDCKPAQPPYTDPGMVPGHLP